MMTATAIIATLTASVVVVMNTGYTAWTAQEADIDVLENGYGVLRHFVRQMRQATAITAITASGNTQGSLTFTTAAGATCTWARNASNDVYYNNGTANQLLAKNINSLTFTGYKADGITATTTVAELSGDGVIPELVRMLGASEGDRAASQHARQLLRAA